MAEGLSRYVARPAAMCGEHPVVTAFGRAPKVRGRERSVGRSRHEGAAGRASAGRVAVRGVLRRRGLQPAAGRAAGTLGAANVAASRRVSRHIVRRSCSGPPTWQSGSACATWSPHLGAGRRLFLVQSAGALLHVQVVLAGRAGRSCHRGRASRAGRRRQPRRPGGLPPRYAGRRRARRSASAARGGLWARKRCAGSRASSACRPPTCRRRRAWPAASLTAIASRRRSCARSRQPRTRCASWASGRVAYAITVVSPGSRSRRRRSGARGGRGAGADRRPPAVAGVHLRDSGPGAACAAGA